MEGISRQEAAERAGATIDLVNQLIDSGLLGQQAGDRFTSGDVRKIGLLRDLLEGGLPLDALVARIGTGRLSLDFMDNAAFEMFSGFSSQTFEDLSNATGIPVETLLVIPEAISAAIATPTDRVRESELEIVPMIQAQVESGYSLAVVERGLRTMGDAMRRLSVADVDAFRDAVILPVARPLGVRGATVGEVVAAATQRIVPATDKALLAIYHAQYARTWTANLLAGWGHDLAVSGLHETISRPPAMCFLDITGYTRMTTERGDEAAAELARELAALVQRTSAQYGGRAVKWLGDGVMFHFPRPGPGVLAALDMAAGVTAAGLPPAHVGLHAGPVVMQDGDYYGQTVNLASRIAEYARPGEVIVSQAVVDAAEDSPLEFGDLGEVELKGVTGTVHLHTARRSGS